MNAPVASEGPASLIAALRDPACFPHPVARVEVVETHISWVILTGNHAYKIKKPLKLDFLDFSTLEARRRYCLEELRLNHRFAPSIYEAVVKITGSAQQPVVGGKDSALAIEYALRMHEFPQEALASRLLARGALHAFHIDALAARIAAFHAGADVAADDSPYGTSEAVIKPARDNFVQLERLLPDAVDQTRLAELRTWTDSEYHRQRALFDARRAQGCVRECHGDLHLGNIVMLDDVLTPFDCIEFDTGLRWIDVINEVAFLVMDLMDRHRADLANRFLNRYLEADGGYAGLGLLRFYLAYRALVRAKVHVLRARQGGVGDISGSEHLRLLDASRGYLDLAQHCALERRSAMLLMHGLSGSGKSVIAQALAEAVGAIRIRSDVERKRLRGLAPLARSDSPLAEGLYAADQTQATYHRLLDLARTVVDAGYAVIVDATFLRRWQRDGFRREAAARGIPFLIVDVTAPPDVLQARIDARLAAGGDASEANTRVLNDQLARREALTGEETTLVLRIDSAHADLGTVQRHAVSTLRARLAAGQVDLSQ